jgi:hypothetical protein
MDGQRFDLFAKTLGARRSRRGVLGAALGLTLGAGALDDAGAVRRRTCRPLEAGCITHAQCCSAYCVPRLRGVRNRRSYCGCRVTDSWCGDACIDTTSDAANCGGCGVECASNEVCLSGVCSTPCIAAWGECGQGQGECCAPYSCWDGLCGAL